MDFDGFPEEALRWKAKVTERSLWIKGGGIPQDLFEKITAKVVTYLKARLAGHTAKYSADSMAWAPSVSLDTAPTLRQKLLNAFPNLPAKWLHETTNTYGTSLHRPAKGSNPHVIPPRDQEEVVALEYRIFTVRDGPVTWEYHVAEKDSHISNYKHDSQEDDPRKFIRINSARKEAEDWMKRQGIKGRFGSVHSYWNRLKRTLKESYSIEWLSPKELNPYIEFD